jgi:hypothetical protein
MERREALPGRAGRWRARAGQSLSGSLRAAAEAATPLSKARYQVAVVIATGLARPGLSEDDPDMRALTAYTVGALVRALD